MAQDTTAEYCNAVRTELSGLILEVNRGQQVLWTDGRFRIPAKSRLHNLLLEFSRVGRLMREPRETGR